MDNIDFLKQILTSNACYWIAAKKEWINRYGSIENQPDSIWIICVPHDMLLNIEEDQILLKDIEKLYRSEVSNIAISDDFPPFQYGVSMRHFRLGFPITKNIKEFVTKALQLGSKNIFDYKQLLEETEKEEEVTNQLL